MLIINVRISMRITIVMIGEKSNIKPGPPRGDLSTSLRTGINIGSEAENTNATTRPLAIGIHERKTRTKIRPMRMLNNQRTASMTMLMTAYLRP